MRISVKLKTLIVISAAMIIIVLSFSLGYFKAKMDLQKFSDTYAVSVEKLAESDLLEEKTTPSVENPLLVNINTASAAELEALPGIGPVIAERIVAHREANGEFKNRYNIMDVPGIGAGIYDKIKDSICVNDMNQGETEK